MGYRNPLRRSALALTAFAVLAAARPRAAAAQDAPPTPPPPAAPAPAEATPAAPATTAAPAEAAPATPLPPASAPLPDQQTPVANGESATSPDAQLTDLSAELAALGAPDVASKEPQFSLYGFADFSYTTPLGKPSPLGEQYGSFMVGNFNVYLSTEINSHWRSLAEVRFLYLPHGAVSGGSGAQLDAGATRIDTSVQDPADFNRPLRWGGVEIERLWLEYSLNQLLTVRMGQWLTPYGIWNVDHGSPTIIGVNRPFIIGEGWFPERQTGIEAYGTFFLRDVQLGYHLTLSNGRGPIDSYRDLDDNKAIGARLFARNRSSLGTITLGVSGYRGRYTDRGTIAISVDNGELVGNAPPTQKYDELDLAADVKWEWDELLVQSEAILSDIRYDDQLRPPVGPFPPGPPGQTPDVRRVGVYVLAGYRTPWWNLMPYVLWQDYHNPLLTDAHEYTAGLNLRPLPQVTLKAEYKLIMIPDSDGLKIPDITVLALQAAWSF